MCKRDIYIRRVNRVKLADIMFSLLCFCLSIRPCALSPIGFNGQNVVLFAEKCIRLVREKSRMFTGWWYSNLQWWTRKSNGIWTKELQWFDSFAVHYRNCDKLRIWKSHLIVICLEKDYRYCLWLQWCERWRCTSYRAADAEVVVFICSHSDHYRWVTAGQCLGFITVIIIVSVYWTHL